MRNFSYCSTFIATQNTHKLAIIVNYVAPLVFKLNDYNSSMATLQKLNVKPKNMFALHVLSTTRQERITDKFFQNL